MSNVFGRPPSTHQAEAAAQTFVFDRILSLSSLMGLRSGKVTLTPSKQLSKEQKDRASRDQHERLRVNDNQNTTVTYFACTMESLKYCDLRAVSALIRFVGSILSISDKRARPDADSG